MDYPVPSNEKQRIKALHELEILESEESPDLNELVELARELFDAPIGLLSLIDTHRQWFKAKAGLEETQTPREIAFCNYPITSSEPLVVEDTVADPRFSANPFVTDKPNIRFYAGVPLALEPGVNLGTLCVLDTKCRVFSSSDLAVLRRLGNIAESLLAQHRKGIQIAKLSLLTNEQFQVISDHAASLSRQKRLFDSASRLAKLGAWELDPRTKALHWSEGLYALHEIDGSPEIQTDKHLQLYPEPERTQLANLVTRSQDANAGFTFEGRMYTSKGNLRWMRVVSDVELEDGKCVRRFGVQQDITDQKLLTDRVQFLAHCDDLTKLANRRGLREKLFALLGDRSDAVSFILIDLDGFKAVNDGYGHAAGDACLRRVARRLRAIIPKNCMIARMGGDEFAIVQTGAMIAEVGSEYFDVLVEAIQKPIKWRSHTFMLSCCIGVTSRSPGETFGPDDLIGEADLALYDAKAAGGHCRRTYRPALKADVDKKIQVLADTTEALASKRMELYYQPKVRLVGGAVIGFEALLRMNTLDGKVVAPGAFLPALDDPALSKEIGDFVIDAALSQAAKWQKEKVPFGSIAINLSASQFLDPAFARKFIEALHVRRLTPSAIEVEVTEGIFLSSAAGEVLSACRTLKAAGISIAFDDFGTGYASLSHLRDFPVNMLKIDRSFIGGLSGGSNAAAIVNAMVALGINLSMSVVAEGIETQAQLDFLRAIGCEQGQGYFFARPMQASDVPRYLRPDSHALSA